MVMNIRTALKVVFAYGSAYTRWYGLINYKGTKAKCRHLKKLTCKGTFAAGDYQSLLTGDTVCNVVIFVPSFVSNPCRKVPLQINFRR
jgi:hypothetical protein